MSLRMNASMRPSGDNAGAIAESLKSVNCVNVSDGGLGADPHAP